MNAQTQSFSLSGGAGHIECKLDLPAQAAPLGVALIAHPHPLYGGSMDNKVVQTLVRAFLALGYVCARMNFRGMGESAVSPIPWSCEPADSPTPRKFIRAQT